VCRSDRAPVALWSLGADLEMNSETASLSLARPPRLPPAQRSTTPTGVCWADLLGPPALPPSDCTALDALARLRSVSVGRLVFSHGGPSSALVVLLSGDVALGLAAPGETMRTERLVHGPAWIVASSAWLGTAHVLDAIALTEVQVAELAREPLQALLDRRPPLARRLLVSLAGEVRRLTVHAHELMHKDAPARLATWLGEHCLPPADGANQAVVRLAERKSDIASQLGLTPETLSRLMRTLSDQGVIEVEGYCVQVRDLQALRRLAGA